MRPRLLVRLALPAGLAALLLTAPAAAFPPYVASEADLAPLADIRAIALPPVPAVTYYVSAQTGGDFPVGNDNYPGTSPDRAFHTIDAAREAANAAPCPVEVVMDGGDFWWRNAYGEGFHHLVPHCDDPNAVGIYIHSSDPDKRWVMDGAEASPSYCDGTGYGSGGITAGDTGEPDGGWVVVANFVLKNCDDDGLDTSHAGRLLALDFRCEHIYGAGNQCATPHASTRMVLLNFEIDGGDDSGENSAGMQPSGESVFIAMFGTARWTGNGPPFAGPNSHTRSLLYRVELERVGPYLHPSSDLLSTSDASDGGDGRVSLLVGRARGMPDTLDVLQSYVTGVDSRRSYRFFRTTFEGGNRLLLLQPKGEGSSVSYRDRCGVYDSYDQRILTTFAPPDKIDLNVANAGFDDSASGPFRLTDAFGVVRIYPTVEAARAGAAGTWTNFFRQSARPGEERRCVESWFEPFPVFSDAAEPRVAGEWVCLPAWVTGEPICALHLNQEGNQPYGYTAE